MNSFQKCAAIAAVLVLGMGAAASFAADSAKPKAPAAAPASNKPTIEVINYGWQQRCGDKDKKKDCEIFQKLETKTDGKRIAEFAVGFPQDKSIKKGVARGVIILPLGILLEVGGAMKIDDGKAFNFKPRFCSPAGCFSYVNLDKTVLDSMKKGKSISLFCKTVEGQDVNVMMDLAGFEKALQAIQ